MSPRKIAKASCERFQKDGACVLHGVFRDWVDVLRDGIAQNLAHPGPHARIYHDEKTGGMFLSDFCNWDRIEAYRDFIFHSSAATLGAELMSCKPVYLFHEHVLVKQADTGIPTPWHQDQPYYCVSAERTVSFWIPLDPVPRERSLEFICGSHLWGKLFRPTRFNGEPLNAGDGLESLPDIEGNRDKYRISGWPLEPGDAVAFDYRTVHGAPANNSKTQNRRAFSLRLVGGEARFIRPHGLVSSPPFTDINLGNGALLNHTSFPRLLP